MSQLSADITIVGLGPGDPTRRTGEVQAALDSGARLFLRTSNHPGLEDLSERASVTICDKSVGNRGGGGKDWAAAALLVCDAAREETVVLAVPGHPRFGERLVIETLEEADRRGLSTSVLDGLSVMDLMATALGVDPMIEDLQFIDAAQFAKRIGNDAFGGGLFPFTPLRPMLFSRVYGNAVTSALSRSLCRVFPVDHPVMLVSAAGIDGEEEVIHTTVGDLALQNSGLLTSLWVPAQGTLEAVRDPRTQQHITALLRAPDGCPWDREQTHASLRDNIIDEAYEVVDAIDAGDTANLAEELGDLFLLICMHAQIAEEQGEFTLEDVYEGIATKIIRRHPHVFGDVVAESASDLAEIWASVKAQEKADKPVTREKSVDGEPHSMPALVRSTRVLKQYPAETHASTSADVRSRDLLNAVAAIVSAGDDPEQVLREALAEHVTNQDS